MSQKKVGERLEIGIMRLGRVLCEGIRKSEDGRARVRNGAAHVTRYFPVLVEA
jgi:hypothetical protein